MRTILILLFMHATICILAQSEILENTLENQAQDREIEEDSDQDYLSNLNYFIEHPINLKSAHFEELNLLNLLTPNQLEDLFKHVELNGELLCLEELQVLPHWDDGTIRSILPFVKLKDEVNETRFYRRDWTKGKSYILSRMNIIGPTKEGYKGDDPKYIGNPFKLLEQYRYNYYNRLKIGITMEKDPGENFAWNSSQKGFDFTAGYIGFSGGRVIRNWIVGDYQVQLGQGLIYWQGNSFGKSSEPTSLVKIANKSKVYSSADEVNYGRGAVTEIAFGKFSLCGFYSHKWMDGTVSDSIATGWTQNGLHRTMSEMGRRKNLEEKVLGGSLGWGKQQGRINVNSYFLAYNSTLKVTDQIYQKQFDALDQRWYSSVDYRFGFKNLYFFGEIGGDQNLKGAAINGLMLSSSEKISLSIMHRSFMNGFYSPFESVLGRIGSSVAERAVFIVFNYKPSRKIDLSGYAEQYRIDWLRYLVSSTHVGSDYLVQFIFRPDKKVQFTLRFRNRVSEANSKALENSIKEIESVRQISVRSQLTLHITQNLSLKSRLEWTGIERKSVSAEEGFLLYQDLNLQPKFKKWSLHLRYALFTTDSYDTRIYAYENSALFVYSVPAYYYQGYRYYLVTKIPLGKSIELWFKYAQTHYRNKLEISSGNEKMSTSTKHELLVQFRWKLNYSKSK